jgi:Asp-tRNA(Asn)/Glu-tRNA(Gln) amidotransferase A subunit family amidase
MNQRDLPLRTVAELAPHLEKQAVLPVEVVAASLERIEWLDTQLHA